MRPVNSSHIQFVNTTSNSTVRPIIFHQKSSTTSTQPQLLTVMPAGVRVQQLTPVGRTSSNQGTTIVRLMSPTMRSGTGQQQIIQLNTNKQQQPLVIKAITTSSNRQQQQPILLAANTQQKLIQPQMLTLNQSQQGKFTLQMSNKNQEKRIQFHKSTELLMSR
jgi:hypothetical protein